MGGLIALAISLTFCILYNHQLGVLDATTNACTVQVDDQTIDVYERFRFVCKFGFGVYLALSICTIFACASGFHPYAALFNQCLHCCLGIPGLVQVIFLGIYRLNSAGRACSGEGAALESTGDFLLNMFIAQLCLNGVYMCCSSLGSGVNKQK